MDIVKLEVTTDGSGDGSATSSGRTGLLFAVQCVDGTFADGVDLDVTCEQGDLSIALFSVDNFNTDIIYYPRVLENLNTDGTALASHCMPVVVGPIKATIANGGATTSGTIICYVIEF